MHLVTLVNKENSIQVAYNSLLLSLNILLNTCRIQKRWLTILYGRLMNIQNTLCAIHFFFFLEDEYVYGPFNINECRVRNHGEIMEKSSLFQLSLVIFSVDRYFYQ
jgi:hypothetical protein